MGGFKKSWELKKKLQFFFSTDSCKFRTEPHRGKSRNYGCIIRILILSKFTQSRVFLAPNYVFLKDSFADKDIFPLAQVISNCPTHCPKPRR